MIIYEEIFKELDRQKVKYVLVGGLAVNLLGAFRSTADLDLLVAMTDENLRKIVRILKKQGYRVKQPVDPMGIADQKTREDWIKNKHMKAFNFYQGDGLNEVDLIIDSPISFEQARKTARRIKIDDLVLPVVSVDNLIKMKQNTGRSVDELDIKELKKIKKLRKTK